MKLQVTITLDLPSALCGYDSCWGLLHSPSAGAPPKVPSGAPQIGFVWNKTKKKYICQQYNLLIHFSLSLHTAVFFSLQSLCLVHTGKRTGVAVSHCITWFQTQPILTMLTPNSLLVASE